MFCHGIMLPKDQDGRANSADQDLYALGLHCLPRPLCPKTKDYYGMITVLSFGTKLKTLNNGQHYCYTMTL